MVAWTHAAELPRLSLADALSRSMSTNPDGYFYFLNLLAVLPERQGQGLGSALLAHTLDRCDREGVPAYLDATSEDNRRLYERHGFEAGAPYAPAGGPPLYPMWRDPRS